MQQAPLCPWTLLCHWPSEGRAALLKVLPFSSWAPALPVCSRGLRLPPSTLPSPADKATPAKCGPTRDLLPGDVPVEVKVGRPLVGSLVPAPTRSWL